MFDGEMVARTRQFLLIIRARLLLIFGELINSIQRSIDGTHVRKGPAGFPYGLNMSVLEDKAVAI